MLIDTISGFLPGSIGRTSPGMFVAAALSTLDPVSAETLHRSEHQPQLEIFNGTNLVIIFCSL